MTTGLPPAPVPQEPVDPTARASLELPLLFQPHIDLEKTSGGGAPTDQAASTSQVNGLSQSQDSEAAGFEAITTDEPFRGYSFEVCLSSRLPPPPRPLLVSLGGGFAACPQGYNSRNLELTHYHLAADTGIAMPCL